MLYGWTPTETHEHYDADGNLTGRTVIRRESAWDDGERDAQHALDLLVCPSCGNLRSVCSDPARDWHPHESVCWPTATREWGVRRLQAKHEKVEVSDDALHPLDGVSVWVADEPPEDDPFA